MRWLEQINCSCFVRRCWCVGSVGKKQNSVGTRTPEELMCNTVAPKNISWQRRSVNTYSYLPKMFNRKLLIRSIIDSCFKVIRPRKFSMLEAPVRGFSSSLWEDVFKACWAQRCSWSLLNRLPAGLLVSPVSYHTAASHYAALQSTGASEHVCDAGWTCLLLPVSVNTFLICA